MKKDSVYRWSSLFLVALFVMACPMPNSGGGGEPVTPENPPAQSAPATPSALTSLTASSSQINLSWSDNSANETSFRIEVSSTSASAGFALLTTTAANVTSYTSTGLTASTQYWYRVRAANTTGDSAWSTVATAITNAPASTAPTAPSALTALTASSSQINLSWSDNSANETSFRIERSITSASAGFALLTTTGANVTSYSSTGLSASTQYWYRVRAANAIGDSAWCTVATATTSAPAPTAPTAPSGLNASANYNASFGTWSVNLTWTDNASNETAYLLERSSISATTNFSLLAELSANVTTYSNTNVLSGTQYWYRVRCSNSGGFSAYSTVATATTTASSQTVTLYPQYDNLIMTSSTNSAIAGTVYQTSELAVGANWNYSTLTGIQDYVIGASLVRFNTSTLAGKTIESASLILTTQYYGVGSHPRQWQVRTMESSWASTTMTWTYFQGTSYRTGSQITQNAPTYTGQQFSINVLPTVQNWASATWDNNGFCMVSTDYTFPYAISLDAFAFYSVEAATAANRPRLVVTYH